MALRADMLKILRAKFIAINMVLAAVVLATSFAVVCYTDYSSRLNALFSELEVVLAEAQAPKIPQIEGVKPLEFHITVDVPQAAGEEDAVQEEQEDESAEDDAENRSYFDQGVISYNSNIFGDSEDAPQVSAPAIGSLDNISNSSVVLIAVYDVTPEGRYTTLADYTTATIPEGILLRANSLVTTGTVDKGYIDEFGLYFERQPYGQDYLVAYADGSSVNNWKTLAWTLAGVCAASLVAFFFINIFFSRWALRPVEQSIKQQQQFTADASHELKTPLTVILANMAILSSQPEETVEDQMQWVDSTTAEAERMQKLVNDMLALSRPKERVSADKEKPSEQGAMEKVDFSDLVESEVLQFESVAFERQVMIDSEIEEGLYVKGDPERLGRMVATLIDNACKYADEGGTVSVELLKGETAKTAEKNHRRHSARKKNRIMRFSKIVELNVHNTGSVIPEEDLPHVFDRFYRADKARSSSTGGYGLGLAIGYEIAQDYNGNITVASTEEEGTTFTVTLPLEEKGEE